jgi:8-oxo-dGTP pyrophosphatase MutT (NUDIX family)
MIDMQEIYKVYAYITRGEKILVFRHVDFPEAGIQVPGGTMEAGEDRERAVLREAEEESGLTGLVVNRHLGRDVFQDVPNTKMMRHFFHLICPVETPETWQHYEETPSDGSPGPILFEFYWLPLDEAAEELDPYFAAGLERLATSRDGKER